MLFGSRHIDDPLLGPVDTVHKLEHLFTELDKLDCVLPDAFKRNSILLQLRGVAPEIYTALAVKTDMKFVKTVAEVKKLAALFSESCRTRYILRDSKQDRTNV